ncbi:uncharacterized protein LOC124265801 [Haliotis rubra]|uniref:uncharacterized protein LOC124265801 n=1 Tax=Haliotis rubra TaxID=36100 RepID=UPI001EE54AA1|nr:uncharacterized protein LOC124265801 [Haliotis rubra]XP_046556590.1 uncharacterized protein LOC124265801 [Haliotis rubra]XP_046556591.1 uncharacterized protein LOC124265801 [Haliotis rubra]
MTTSSSSSPNNCSICLDPFNSPAACIPCGHVFCNLCINQWYSNSRGGAHGMCPQCRTSILSIQTLRIDDGNISIHHSSVGARIVNFFYQQWFTLTRSVHDLAAEIPTSVTELEQAAERYQLPNIVQVARRIRRLPATMLLSWFNLGPDVQLFTLLILILLASLLIKDLQNPVGLFHNCVFPITSLCKDIVRETLCCLLLVICRPLVCVGQCILEVLLALWDIFFGMIVSVTLVTYYTALIPCVVLGAVIEWTCALVIFLSETFIALLRLAFIMALVLVPGYFAQTTEEQRSEYFQNFVTIMQTVRDRYQVYMTSLQDRYINAG